MPTVHLFYMPYWLHWSIGGIVTALAFWRGGWRERAVAGSQLATVLWAHQVCVLWTCWRGSPPLAMVNAIIVDPLALAVCIACSVRAPSYWPLWASSLALLQIVVDLVALLQPGWGSWPLAAASYILTYLVYVTVLWGVWTTRRDGVSSAGRGPRGP